jgi:hypothetical protein
MLIFLSLCPRNQIPPPLPLVYNLSNPLSPPPPPPRKRGRVFLRKALSISKITRRHNLEDCSQGVYRSELFTSCHFCFWSESRLRINYSFKMSCNFLCTLSSFSSSTNSEWHAITFPQEILRSSLNERRNYLGSAGDTSSWNPQIQIFISALNALYHSILASWITGLSSGWLMSCHLSCFCNPRV